MLIAFKLGRNICKRRAHVVHSLDRFSLTFGFEDSKIMRLKQTYRGTLQLKPHQSPVTVKSMVLLALQAIACM